MIQEREDPETRRSISSNDDDPTSSALLEGLDQGGISSLVNINGLSLGVLERGPGDIVSYRGSNGNVNINDKLMAGAMRLKES